MKGMSVRVRRVGRQIRLTGQDEDKGDPSSNTEVKFWKHSTLVMPHGEERLTAGVLSPCKPEDASCEVKD